MHPIEPIFSFFSRGAYHTTYQSQQTRDFRRLIIGGLSLVQNSRVIMTPYSANKNAVFFVVVFIRRSYFQAIFTLKFKRHFKTHQIVSLFNFFLGEHAPLPLKQITDFTAQYLALCAKQKRIKNSWSPSLILHMPLYTCEII